MGAPSTRHRFGSATQAPTLHGATKRLQLIHLTQVDDMIRYPVARVLSDTYQFVVLVAVAVVAHRVVTMHTNTHDY